MTFGINKWATLVPLPNAKCYTYLGIPFENDLNLNKIVFFKNRHIPIEILNKCLYWIYGFRKKKKLILSIYAITEKLHFIPLSAKCVLAQARCFHKWTNNNKTLTQVKLHKFKSEDIVHPYKHDALNL
ncbi:hypothetical protein H8356DRAFT_1358121 [Neocallimastix lanati (nom. inval.)]|nr:hypothetical protein H8356DRAFT_1358121 [Neocallimastix sp. JGI-2020a]